jgi:hypothetical protein
MKPQIQENVILCKQLQDMLATARPNSSEAKARYLEVLITKFKDIFTMKSSEYR